MNSKKLAILAIAFSFVAANAFAMVQDEGIINVISAPSQVQAGSVFTISNNLTEFGIDYNSFEPLPDGDFEDGTFTPDWNGGEWKTSTDDLSFSNRLSSSASCPSPFYCAESSADLFSSSFNN